MFSVAFLTKYNGHGGYVLVCDLHIKKMFWGVIYKRNNFELLHILK